MTCREKLKKEHPTELSDMWIGGCLGCPDEETRRYIAPGQTACRGNKVVGAGIENCTKCWDTEIPEVEKEEPETAPSELKPRISNMQDLLWFVEKVMANWDKSVNIYIRPDGDFSVSVYPYKKEEDK